MLQKPARRIFHPFSRNKKWITKLKANLSSIKLVFSPKCLLQHALCIVKVIFIEDFDVFRCIIKLSSLKKIMIHLSSTNLFFSVQLTEPIAQFYDPNCTGDTKRHTRVRATELSLCVRISHTRNTSPKKVSKSMAICNSVVNFAYCPDRFALVEAIIEN